jgi:SAM-dependent methyltransferase
MTGFDRFKDTYENQVEELVRFSGKDQSFFTRTKARWLLDLAARHVGAPSGLSVLDVGCGVGLTDSELVDSFGSVSGVDISPAMIERAVERNPSVDYRVYDGSRLPYDDEAFGVVFAICVFHHVPFSSRPALVREMRRVLRPGGLALIVEHNPLNPITRLIVSRCAFDEDAELLRVRESEELLRGARLDSVERRYILIVPSDSGPAHRLERVLGGLPFGAQYLVAAKRPDDG